MSFSKKICFVVSTPMTTKVFLKDQIEVLSKYFEVTSVANFTDNPEYQNTWGWLKIKNIPLTRSAKPIQDLKALFKLFIFLKKEQFSVVHTITPKAGLIGIMAAFFAGVKIRIHTYTGQVWVTRKGLSRWFLKRIDWGIACLATHAYADSPSQRNFLIRKRVIQSKKIKALADGSISGVDLNRFAPDKFNRQKIRKAYGLKEDSVVILFLGRMNMEKGIKDLIKAFIIMKAENAHLFLVGPDDRGMRSQLVSMAGQEQVGQHIHFVDYTEEPQKYMAAADIFCLPSYREGFGSVVIEAAACELPSVASRIYGLTDAIIHGLTGLLYQAGDIEALLQALVKLVDDPILRKRMGKAARNRAMDLFNMKRLTQALLEEYLALSR